MEYCLSVVIFHQESMKEKKNYQISRYRPSVNERSINKYDNIDPFERLLNLIDLSRELTPGKKFIYPEKKYLISLNKKR